MLRHLEIIKFLTIYEPMEKEENQNNTPEEENQNSEKETEKPEESSAGENKQEIPQETNEEIKEPTPEEKIAELEDKLARTFAEMENQRRRFEKEKEDAFEYGGSSFAKEALNLIDNLDRSKHVLESDDKLKETDALKKTMEHLSLIHISEPTRLGMISYAVFCLKKKNHAPTGAGYLL